MPATTELAQESEDGESVIAYASRLLKQSEIKYGMLQKEALGIVWSLKHFYPYLYGRHFTVVTDHRPLKWLNTMTVPNNLFACWISEIQSYYFDVIHRPGKLDGNADYMSRYPVQDDLMAVIDLRGAQLEDTYCGAWIKYLEDDIVLADKKWQVAWKRRKIDTLWMKVTCTGNV